MQEILPWGPGLKDTALTDNLWKHSLWKSVTKRTIFKENLSGILRWKVFSKHLFKIFKSRLKNYLSILHKTVSDFCICYACSLVHYCVGILLHDPAVALQSHTMSELCLSLSDSRGRWTLSRARWHAFHGLTDSWYLHSALLSEPKQSGLHSV